MLATGSDEAIGTFCDVDCVVDLLSAIVVFMVDPAAVVTSAKDSVVTAAEFSTASVVEVGSGAPADESAVDSGMSSEV